MIQVYTNKENYQYDLHSLIKAFYPERDVKVHGLEQISRLEERGRTGKSSTTSLSLTQTRGNILITTNLH